MPTVGRCGLCASNSERSFAPKEKDTRTIVREEIQRQKQLDKLEEKYNAGEISKFEYTVQKAIIKGLPVTINVKPDVCKFATTA